MSNIDPELLKRYANGHCTPTERGLVEEWLGKDKNTFDPQLFTGIDKVDLKEKMWQDINPVHSHTKARIHIPAYVYKLAACFVLVVFSLFFVLKYDRNSNTNKLEVNRVTYKELLVPKGRKAQITLADGTVISLNADSRIKYPITFTGHTRIVYLSGEAQFKVAKDPSKPFVIYTAKTDTRVLGTVFNIKAYPEESNTVLTVEEGKVQFSLRSDAAKYLILTPDKQGIAGPSQTLQMQQVYAAGYTAWKSDKLILNDLSLAEIAPILNRWYNARVIVNNKKIEKKRFTGTYQHGPLNLIGQDISLVFHCHFKAVNNTLIFY
jgi:transmembrane sensor